MESEVAIVPHQFGLIVARDPKVVLAEAQRAAKALKDIIEAKPKDKKVMMNGEQYLELEDWQLCAKFYGVVAKIVSTQYVEIGGARGFEAIAAAFDTATGQEVSRAESLCLNDEEKWSTRSKYEWKEGKREKVGDVAVPLFQLKSMAQTRACSKVLRNVLAWVVVLAGYKPTPAEDMTGDEDLGKPKGAPIKGPEAAKPTNGTAKPAAAPASGDEDTITFVPAATSTKPDKNGKPRWAVKSPGNEWYSTYDPEAGAIACSGKELNKPVTLTYVTDGSFSNIKSARLAE